MREDLLKHGGDDPELASVDDDLAHLLSSWFNRGFLVLRRIDWSTPADILERIIRYEAVHEIQGWDDLRRRVQPTDRRCFAFFHPSLIDEPLIFVEVALTREIPASIQGAAGRGARDRCRPSEATTAVFYSISNCQPGLRGVSFGNFLIKQVVEELSRELPVAHDLRHPLAGARASPAWLAAQADPGAGSPLDLAPRPGIRLARRCGVAERAAAELLPLGGRLLPRAPRAPAASRSTRWPASTSATVPGSSGSTGSATPRPRACARRTG